MPWRLLSLAPASPDRVRGWFEGLEDLEVEFPAARTPEAVLAALPQADILVPDWSGALRVGSAEVAAARRLSFVMSASVGLDSLDLPTLTAAGIVVANPAGINARSVAEWCLGAAFVVARSMVWVDHEIRAGAWPQLELPERGSMELDGRRVGVVGFGAVGSRVARLFAAVGCDVSYWTRTAREDAHTAAVWRPLDDLVASSDILVVNIALTEDTHGLLDAARLARLPHGAIVIDASRGGVVDVMALTAMVEDGRLRGAAIDVFAVEPLPMDHPVRQSDRILLSSHAAATTAQSVERIFALVRSNVARAIAGEPVESIANGLGPRITRRPGPP